MKLHAWLVSCGQLLTTTIFLLLINCIFICSKATAQDIIIRTDAVRIAAKMLVIGETEIRYRMYEDPEEQEYVISRQDVLSVEQENGVLQDVNIPAIGSNWSAPKNYNERWRRNQVMLNLPHLFPKNLTISYERILLSGKLGIRIPVSFILTDDYSFTRDLNAWSVLRQNTVFGTGLALNIYPFGQSRFNYYGGAQVDLLNFRYDTYNSSQNMLSYHVGQLVSVAMNHGVLYQFTERMVAAVEIGAGVRAWHKMETTNTYYDKLNNISRFYIPVKLQVGVRI